MTCKCGCKTKNHAIEGREYIEVEREAQEGDYVIIIDDSTNGFPEGHIGVVTGKDVHFVVIDGAYVHHHEDYRVLEPKPKSTEDLLANLARRVTKIERKLAEIDEQVDSNTKDIRTIGEESAKALFLAETADVNNEIAFKDVEKRLDNVVESIEMLTDDIVTLDERTQGLTEQGIEQLAKDLVGLINERMRRI